MDAEQLLKILEFNQYNFSDILSYILGYLVVLWVLFTFWVLRDISSRTRSVFVIVFTSLFVLVFNIPGLLLYLLLRPEKTIEEARALDLYQISQLEDNLTTCSECRSIVRKHYGFCTNCGTELYIRCDFCGKQINPIWDNCGYCGKEVHPTNRLRYAYRIASLSMYRLVWSMRVMRRISNLRTSIVGFFRSNISRFRLRIKLLRIKTNKVFAPVTSFGRKLSASRVRLNLVIDGAGEEGMDVDEQGVSDQQIEKLIVLRRQEKSRD